MAAQQAPRRLESDALRDGTAAGVAPPMGPRMIASSSLVNADYCLCWRPARILVDYSWHAAVARCHCLALQRFLYLPLFILFYLSCQCCAQLFSSQNILRLVLLWIANR